MSATIYEQILGSCRSVVGETASIFHGASQWTRQNLHVRTAREQTLVDVAAGVAGPVLTGYIYWVLHRAQAMRLQRLCFVSRDGQILLKIAQRLNQELKFPIELRYLYGGRQAWHLPSLFELTEDDMVWLFYAPEYLTIRLFFQRLQILPEDIPDTLESEGFSRSKWDANLKRAQIARLRCLVKSETMRKKICEAANRARENLVAYFRQEGVLDLESWGLVDVGWFGRMQNSLGKALKNEKVVKPVGFYFGLAQHAQKDDFGEKVVYYCDHRQADVYAQLNMPVAAWIEIFTAADHGVVMGYGGEAGSIQPLLKSRCNIPALNWGLVTVQNTIDFFAQNCALSLARLPHPDDVRPLIKSLLHQWIENPSLTEVDVWGSFKMETDQISAYQYTVVRKLNFADVLRRLFGKDIVDLTYLSWPAGCQLITSGFILTLIKVSDKVRVMLKAILQKAQNSIRAQIGPYEKGLHS